MYRDREFLLAHVRSILDFYYPAALDHELGGFFNGLKDDRTVYDRTTRHLVDTCRHIYNFSHASRLFGENAYFDAAKHGLDFLNSAHRMPEGGYAWVLNKREIEDSTRHCYGHAFVLLAASAAAHAGIEDAHDLVGSVFDLLEQRFYEPDQRLYVDVISGGDWTKFDQYRGQNANMHMCEAMLAAYDATCETRYLDRAETLADRICRDLCAGSDGLIWEHYRDDWSIDWNYNRDDPKNLSRPYGFLPGHFSEWSKLLVLLSRERPLDWAMPRAVELFDAAIKSAWDDGQPGFNYAFGPDGATLDADRYYWVLSEAIAASALLGSSTSDQRYWEYYDKFWSYADANFIDHEFGGWHRVLNESGCPYDDLKSPPAKTDYHRLSACVTVLRALGMPAA